ncbi:MAG: zinc-ribbon domain-containing protein, partial [Myxococcales bacterium]|nr:zinc-ribbon domain-containing protein [Myxococcales bacterium]
MHVQCESCATQYEFDDALVSGRGTTVKCSNCGYQFKVRKAGTDDQWLVTTADGSTFVYGSLRELQRAILSRQIDVSDLLERGGVAPRPIGQIAELAPFFDEKRRLSSVAPEADGPATERSVTPPPERPVAVDPDRTAATPARLLEEHLAATRTPVPPP